MWMLIDKNGNPCGDAWFPVYRKKTMAKGISKKRPGTRVVKIQIIGHIPKKKIESVAIRISNDGVERVEITPSGKAIEKIII